MHRCLPALTLTLLLGLPSAPAEAGIGSLLRAVSKVGGKAGTVGAKGAKLGKGGAALKGAGALGAVVASERVFLHVADDVGRIGVFVADDGAGALKVVMRGGDEAAHSVDSFGRLVDDLDGMGGALDGAGVDVFVDASAIGRLDSLAVGKNTRLFLANTDGASWPIRRAAGGAVDVGVADRIWVRVGAHVADVALDVALRVATMPLHGDEPRAVVDPDCDGSTTVGEAIASAEPGETLLLVGEASDLDDAALVELAMAHGVDVVLLGLAEVCPAGEPDAPQLGVVLARMAETHTLGELWAVAADDGAPLVLDQVEMASGQIVVAGAGIVSVFAMPDTPAEELPEWAKAILGALILAGFFGVKLWWSQRTEAGADQAG